MYKRSRVLILVLFLACTVVGDSVRKGSLNLSQSRVQVRSVTVPVTVETGDDSELLPVDFQLHENEEPQQILSIRGPSNSPLTLAILIQDNLVSSVANEIKEMGSFIRGLPRGSRVMTGYMRAGSLQVRQKFTTDTEKAARSLRIPVSNPGLAPYNPYVQVLEAIKRFVSQPVGRRAILVVSDGLDISRGQDSSYPSQSIDLQRAINEAQRRGIAVYSIYAPGAGGTSDLTRLVSNGQGSLKRLSDETGGRAFFQGLGAPVSFDPFIRDFSSMLKRLVAITYLSTHTGKGFHKLRVTATGSKVNLLYPSGYRL
jgi:VWFA-related protein